MYGVAMFDVSSDSARDRIWRDLGTRVLRTTNSCLQFDMKDQDFVDATVRKHIAATDNYYEASALQDDAKAKSWARKAMIQFIDEVMGPIKKRANDAEEAVREGGAMDRRVASLLEDLKAGKKGIGDIVVALEDKAREIRKKTEDQVIRLAIFRLGEEFEVSREAILADLEIRHDLAMVELMKAAKAVEPMAVEAMKSTEGVPQVS